MIGVNRMKFKMFYKTNKRFFITVCIVVCINMVNFIWITSGKAFSNLTYETFSTWYQVMYWDIGDLLVTLMPLFVIIGCSNNILDDINNRFVSNIHVRKAKIKYLIIEVTKSGILGGIIAVVPQLISYMLCLIIFSSSNDTFFIHALLEDLK